MSCLNGSRTVDNDNVNTMLRVSPEPASWYRYPRDPGGPGNAGVGWHGCHR